MLAQIGYTGRPRARNCRRRAIGFRHRLMLATLLLVPACQSESASPPSSVSSRDAALEVLGPLPFSLIINDSSRSTHRPTATGAIESTADGRFRCVRTGTGAVRSASEPSRIDVRCVDVVEIEPAAWTDVEADTIPREVRFVARLRDGSAILVSPISLVSEMPSVVRVVDDSLVALHPGTTEVLVALRGLLHTLHLHVVRTLVRDSLALRPGEFRSWRLEKGLYRVTVIGIDDPDASRSYSLSADGLRCAPGDRAGDSITCRSEGTAHFAIKRDSSSGRSPSVSVIIVQLAGR